MENIGQDEQNTEGDSKEEQEGIFDLLRNEKFEDFKIWLKDQPQSVTEWRDEGDNNTFLHLAIEKGNYEIVKLLLEKGADVHIVNIHDNIKYNALEWAKLLYKDPIPINTILETNMQNLDSDQYYYKFNFEDSAKWSERCLYSCRHHILKIDKCRTLGNVLKFLRSEVFKNTFKKHIYCFLLTISVEGPVTFNNDICDKLTKCFDNERPMIIQLNNIIFFKELNKQFVHYTTKDDTLTEELRMDAFSRKDENCFSSLLNALHSGVGGSFKNDLLKVTLNVLRQFKDGRLIDYVARYKDVLSLRFLLLFQWNLSENNRKEILEIFAEVADLGSIATILKLPLKTNKQIKLTNKANELLTSKNKNKKTHFSVICDRNKPDDIINLYNVYYNDGYHQELMNQLWKFQYYNHITVLLEADACFPNNFVKEQLNNDVSDNAIKLKQLIDDREEFHNDLKVGNKNDVTNYLKNHRKLKIAYNTQNESALSTIHAAQQTNLLKLLNAKKFTVGFNEKTTALHQTKLFMLYNMQKPKESYINDLISKSKFIPDETDYSAKITEIFNKLNRISEVKLVMQVVSHVGNLQILFDFDADSVVYMKPSAGYNVPGLCEFKEMRIYVGAKNETQTPGTLAHELTHLAMQICYQNNCNPYSKYPIRQRLKFEDLVTIYKEEENRKIDDIIDRVYDCYPDAAHWPSELIVRVPQILTHYYGDANVDKINEIKGKASALFEFFKEYTEKDFNRFITNPMNILQTRLIQNLNAKFEVIDKMEKYEIRLSKEFLKNNPMDIVNVLTLTSNVVPLLKTYVYQTLKEKENFGSRYIFTTMNDFNNSARVDEIYEVFSTTLHATLIIDCLVDHATRADFFDNLEKFADYSNIILMCNTEINNTFKEQSDIQYQHKHVEFSWKDIDSKKQNKVLSRCVTFNDRKVKLNEFIKSDSSFITGILLTDLLHKTEIKTSISKCFDYDKKYYVSRSLTQNLQSPQPEPLTESGFLKKISEQNVIIIAGRIGIGKSMFMSNVYEELRKKKSWIIGIDLYNYTQEFEEQAREPIDNDKFLSEEILKHPSSSLENGIFKQRFKDKKVILILDGFNEITHGCRESVLYVIERLKKTLFGQIWIMTTPHLRQVLEERLNGASYNIGIFSSTDEKDFLSKFWKKEISKDEKTQDKLKDYPKALQDQLPNLFKSIERKFTAIPQLLSIVAHFFLDEVKKNLAIGINLPTFNINELQLLDLYKRFLKKRYSRYILNKNDQIIATHEEITNIACESEINFKRFHQQLAVKEFTKKCLPQNVANLLQLKKKHNLSEDGLNRIGIVHKLNGEFSFSSDNEIFIGYYVAEFLIKKLKKSSQLPIIQELMLKILSREDEDPHRIIKMFLNESLSEPVNGVMVNTFREFDFVLDSIKMYWILYAAVVENNFNILRFLLKVLQLKGFNIKDTILFKCAEIQQDQEIWFVTACKGELESINILWAFTEASDRSGLLIATNSTGKNVTQLTKSNRKNFLEKLNR